MGSANVPRRSIALSETSMNTARARRACARCMDKQPAAEGDVFNTSQLVRCKDSVGRAPRDVGESPQQHSAHRVRRVRMNQRRRMMVWAVNTPSTSTNSTAQRKHQWSKWEPGERGRNGRQTPGGRTSVRAATRQSRPNARRCGGGVGAKPGDHAQRVPDSLPSRLCYQTSAACLAPTRRFFWCARLAFSGERRAGSYV